APLESQCQSRIGGNSSYAHVHHPGSGEIGVELQGDPLKKLPAERVGNGDLLDLLLKRVQSTGKPSPKSAIHPPTPSSTISRRICLNQLPVSG
ncbi:hypothetical protein PanWU01x14_344790, partial [Parasponia andersonii]